MRDYELVDTKKRTDIRFNVNELDLVLETSKNIYHYEGDYAGLQLVLNDWQCFLLGNMYAWQKYASSIKRWVFKHKENSVVVARKNGKTFVQAYSAIYDAAYLLPSGAKVFCAATKEEQAKLLWDACDAFINKSPVLSRDFFKVRNYLYVDGTARTSFIKPLGRDSKVASRGGGHEGLNPFTAKIDEIHAHPDDSMYNVLNQAFGARTYRSLTSISTCGENKYSFGKELFDAKEKALRDGTLPDDQFVLHYRIDKGDEERWHDESIWPKANPNLGIGKSIEEMRSLAAGVKMRPSTKNTFLAKQLNCWVDDKQAWLDLEKWYECRSKLSEKDLVGKSCSLGIDLARSRDLSAVAAYFPAQKGLKKPVLLVKFFIDAETAHKRMKDDMVPYEMWREKGTVTFTSGDEIDFEQVENYIHHCRKIFNVQRVGFDPAFAGAIMQNLKKSKIDVVEMRQHGYNYSSVCNKFEIEVNQGKIEYIENDCLDWNISNLAIITYSDDHIMPDKSSGSHKRIDGAVAALVAKFADAAEIKKKIRRPEWLLGAEENKIDSGK